MRPCSVSGNIFTLKLANFYAAHAAVVVGPQSESVHVRSVHLALLQPRVVHAAVHAPIGFC